MLYSLYRRRDGETPQRGKGKTFWRGTILISPTCHTVTHCRHKRHGTPPRARREAPSVGGWVGVGAKERFLFRKARKKNPELPISTCIIFIVDRGTWKLLLFPYIRRIYSVYTLYIHIWCIYTIEYIWAPPHGRPPGGTTRWGGGVPFCPHSLTAAHLI